VKTEDNTLNTLWHCHLFIVKDNAIDFDVRGDINIGIAVVEVSEFGSIVVISLPPGI
jgi:hypothetical protein